MEITPATTTSLFGFITIIIFIISMICFAALLVKKEFLPRVLAFFSFWIALHLTVVQTRVFIDHPLPTIPLFILFMISSALFISLGNVGKHFSILPLWWIVLFQCFRLPLELVLHSWFLSGTIPETMTWTGQNIDIITGILSLAVLIPSLRNKHFYWFFNIIGFSLLLNVIRVAIMSAPLPFSWPLEKPLLLLFYNPYSLIVSICVWSALVGHLLLTRALIRLK